MVVGINLVKSYSESSNRDQIIAGLNDLAILAQEYYKKETAAGGGGGTYSGWSIPPQLKETEAGNFAAVVHSGGVNLSCNGKYIGRNESTVIRVTARVDDKGIRITVVN